MLDPVTLALPMIQTMSGLGAQGSLELTNATGLHIHLSVGYLSLIHISEPTRLHKVSRMPSSA